MLNYKTIARYLGMLILLEGALMILCLVVAFYYKETQIFNFGFCSILTIIIGCILYNIGTKGETILPSIRESYFIVAIVWVVFSAIGMVPFLLCGSCYSVSTAFFEAMSGFTTTGASALPNLDQFPHSVIFWRSLSHWIGGLGIVFFTITLLPSNLQGGSNLLGAEKIGVTREKIHPKSSTTAKWLWSLYAFLTIICALSLWLSGMTIFDSLNFAMSTLSTGGFAPKGQDYLMQNYYNNPYITTTLTVFMFVSGMNFTMLYLAIFKKKFKALLHNEELHFYIYIVLGLGLLCTTMIVIHKDYTILAAANSAFFNIVSLQTTTGFVTEDYNTWYHPIVSIVILSSMAGACGGSTTGGIKSMRVLIVIKSAVGQFKRLIHPRAVIPVRINHMPVYESTENVLLAFFFWFGFLIFAGTICFEIIGLPSIDSLSLAVSCVANVGPISGEMFCSFDDFSMLPASAKWICSFLMLTGRLEIFAILIPFTSSFWTKD